MSDRRSRSPLRRNRRPPATERYRRSPSAEGYRERYRRSPSAEVPRERYRRSPAGEVRQERYRDRRSPPGEVRQERYRRVPPVEVHQERSRRSPSPPKLREIRKDESVEVNPQKEFFDWAKAQRHKDTWMIAGKALVDPESARGTKALSAEGSRILLEGYDQSDTKMIELRAEVQLSRGKVSAPLRKIELDPRSKPSDEEFKSGRKSIVTKIVVINGEQEFPSDVNGEKHPLFPALILRGILEHKEGSKDQEKVAEMANRLMFFGPNWPQPLMIPGQ